MTVLAVRSLSKAFGGVHAVNEASFDIGAGEFLAMIGPNGAGKSTCFNMINGQLAPDSGGILLDGENIAGLAPRDVWRRGVGRTFQLAATFASMTVAENVQMALISHAGEAYGLWRPAASRHRDRALDLLAQVGMRDAADRPSRALAYGDIKRIELAIALANEPKLLLMDEPTAGMAPRERNDLIALVKRLVVERGISVLFTEHSMDVVFAYADRIVVLARGRIIADGNAAAIRDNAQVREVYFHLAKQLQHGNIERRRSEARRHVDGRARHLQRTIGLTFDHAAAGHFAAMDVELRSDHTAQQRQRRQPPVERTQFSAVHARAAGMAVPDRAAESVQSERTGPGGDEAPGEGGRARRHDNRGDRQQHDEEKRETPQSLHCLMSCSVTRALTSPSPSALSAEKSVTDTP